ncbi:MAG: hypothetical protein JXB30_19010 [Anaerolineae bacterium]|nr:hypothetical protein [Anaerolineae bacterium]
MSKASRSKRRRQSTAARSDTSRQYVTISIPILVAMGIVLLVLLMMGINLFLPDVSLIIRGGGDSRAKDIVPRNTDVWIVNADGTLRFATLFFPVRGENAPTSEVYTVTGPLLRKAEDILKVKTFGALSANSEILPGTGGGSDYVYEQYWIERDPKSAVYGVEVLTANSPYIVIAANDGRASTLSVRTPSQDYYAQVIVAVVFAPKTRIITIAYNGKSGKKTALIPYRRINLKGWLVYYFDTTSLETDQSIEIRYSPGEASSDLDILEIDANR